jgi:hypothetical protein
MCSFSTEYLIRRQVLTFFMISNECLKKANTSPNSMSDVKPVLWSFRGDIDENTQREYAQK